MKVVYKYGTGDKIPKGAIYLSTQVETDTKIYKSNDLPLVCTHQTRNVLVWHYFLVEVKEKEN